MIYDFQCHVVWVCLEGKQITNIQPHSQRRAKDNFTIKLRLILVLSLNLQFIG
jgi:hypothetical protein